MKDNSYNYLPDGKIITGYKLMANAVIAKLQILSNPNPGKLFHIDAEMTSTRVLVMSLSNGYAAARDLFNDNVLYKTGEITEDLKGIHYYSKLENLIRSVLDHRWDFSNTPLRDMNRLKKMFVWIKEFIYEEKEKAVQAENDSKDEYRDKITQI